MSRFQEAVLTAAFVGLGVLIALVAGCGKPAPVSVRPACTCAKCSCCQGCNGQCEACKK